MITLSKKILTLIMALAISATIILSFPTKQSKASTQAVIYVTAAADERVTVIPKGGIARAYFPFTNIASSEELFSASCDGTGGSVPNHSWHFFPITVLINGVQTQTYEYGKNFVNFYVPTTVPAQATLTVIGELNIQYTKQFITSTSSPMLITHNAPDEYGLPHIATSMTSECFTNCNNYFGQFSYCNYQLYSFSPRAIMPQAFMSDPSIIVGYNNTGLWKDNWSVRANIGVAGFTPTLSNLQIIFTDLNNNVVATPPPLGINLSGQYYAVSFCLDYLAGTSVWPTGLQSKYAKVRIKHLTTGKFSPYYILKLTMDGGAEYIGYICTKPN